MSTGSVVRKRVGYAEVAESLRSLIEEGKVKEGSLLPTERELRSRYDVSRTTVRRGLQALVDMGWAENSPNRGVIAKSGPRHRISSNVAFIDHSYSLNKYLFLALNQRLQRHGYHLVHVDSHTHSTEGAIKYAADNDFACCIAWPKKANLDLTALGDSTSRCPLITVQHQFPNLESDLVTEDHYQGGYLAATHLAAQGRKRIAVTGMLDILRTNHLRFSGYMQGLFDSGINPNVADYAFCLTSDMTAPDLRVLKARLQDADRPDAIFVLDDFVVPYVARLLEQLGLSVPDDVAIVAFGNDVPYQFGKTQLTTVSIDWDAVADSIVDQAIARLNGDNGPAQTFALPVDLIVRGSCGAPTSQWQGKPFFSHDNNLMFAPPTRASNGSPNFRIPTVS